MATNECQRVGELLPWFVRGTLADDESQLVAAHLERCAGCREDLAEVRTMFRVTGQHLPAGVIADLACGLPATGWPRGVIDEHLRVCAECREELALARGGHSAFRPAGAGSAAWRPWRTFALAASLVACLALGALWRQMRIAPALQETVLVELVPDSHRVRGAGEAGSTVDATRPATLVLPTDRVVEATGYRVRLLAASGETLAELAGVRPDAPGVFVVHAPPGGVPPGASTLVLEAAVAEGWEPLETYRLHARR